MTRSITTAVLVGLALAGAGAAVPAGAQPRLEQTGDGYSAVQDDGTVARGNVVGGREGGLVGGADGDVLYTGPDPVREAGRVARLSGGGEDAALSYSEPAAVGGNRRG